MLSRKALALASLCTIVCGLASAAAAEDFKSSKFLTYPAESQKSYIGSSVMMAGVIAARNAPQQARCIDDWSAKNSSASYPTVVEAMKRFPDHHPTGVIIAVLQKACGSFDYVRK